MLRKYFQVPPFTPWVPGQPIDDGQYQQDNSGEYKPDNSGKYTPDNGEDTSGPRVKPSYTSGENILNAYQESNAVTPKYLPSFPSPKSYSYQPTENPLENDIIKKAFFNTPTPHPDILLHSNPTPKTPPKSFEAASSQHNPTYLK